MADAPPQQSSPDARDDYAVASFDHVHRTWGLGELVRRFVSPKDVTEKRL